MRMRTPDCRSRPTRSSRIRTRITERRSRFRQESSRCSRRPRFWSISAEQSAPAEVKAIGKPILVIAPYLTGTARSEALSVDARRDREVRSSGDRQGRGRLQARSRVRRRGEVPGAAGPAGDLGRELHVDAELARKPMPPPRAEEVSLSEAMKTINPVFAALRTAVQESKLDGVTQNAAKLKPAFTQTETIWDDLGQSAAAEWAREARAHYDIARGCRRRRRLGRGEELGRRPQSTVPELPRRLPRPARRRHVPHQGRLVLAARYSHHKRPCVRPDKDRHETTYAMSDRARPGASPRRAFAPKRNVLLRRCSTTRCRPHTRPRFGSRAAIG